MNAHTPGNHRGQEARPLRATDYTRVLLRRAQLSLAVLAVPVAVLVGVAVAGATDDGAPAGLPSTTDLLSRIEPWPAASATVAALARNESVSGGRTPAGPVLNGVFAGVSTLGSCWILLAFGGTVWRRRLDERDLTDWADGWARVEPLWSGRTV